MSPRHKGSRQGEKGKKLGRGMGLNPILVDIAFFIKCTYFELHTKMNIVGRLEDKQKGHEEGEKGEGGLSGGKPTCTRRVGKSYGALLEGFRKSPRGRNGKKLHPGGKASGRTRK